MKDYVVVLMRDRNIENAAILSVEGRDYPVLFSIQGIQSRSVQQQQLKQHW